MKFVAVLFATIVVASLYEQSGATIFYDFFFFGFFCSCDLWEIFHDYLHTSITVSPIFFFNSGVNAMREFFSSSYC